MADFDQKVEYFKEFFSKYSNIHVNFEIILISYYGKPFSYCRSRGLKFVNYENVRSSWQLCLQETWYCKQDLAKLNTIHKDFHGTGVATIDHGDQLYSGHPNGGVAIMWRKGLDKYVKHLKFDLNWLVGIEIKIENKTYTLL